MVVVDLVISDLMAVGKKLSLDVQPLICLNLLSEGRSRKSSCPGFKTCSMCFLSGILSAGTSKTLLACAASPGLVVDPDSQNQAVDAAPHTLRWFRQLWRWALWTWFGCAVKGKLETDRLLFYRYVCSQLLCHTLCCHARPPRHGGLWSLSPGTSSLHDLQILKAEFRDWVHSDSPARSWKSQQLVSLNKATFSSE